MKKKRRRKPRHNRTSPHGVRERVYRPKGLAARARAGVREKRAITPCEPAISARVDAPPAEAPLLFLIEKRTGAQDAPPSLFLHKNRV